MQVLFFGTSKNFNGSLLIKNKEDCIKINEKLMIET